MAVGVLNVGNVEAAGVLLDVLEDTDSTDVVTTDDQNLSAVLVLNEALNFAGLEVKLQVSIFNIKIIQRERKEKGRQVTRWIAPNA